MTKNFAKTALVLLALVLALGSGAQAQQTEIKWFGHAAFSITTPKGKVLIIDPWLKNPVNPEAADGKDPPRGDHPRRLHFADARAFSITSAKRSKSPKDRRQADHQF